VISSAQVALLERLKAASSDLAYAVEEGLARRRQRLELEVSRLRRHSPELRIENAWLRLDDARTKLDQLAFDGLAQVRRRLEKAYQGVQRVSPEFTVRMHRERLTQLGHRLD